MMRSSSIRQLNPFQRRNRLRARFAARAASAAPAMPEGGRPRSFFRLHREMRSAQEQTRSGGLPVKSSPAPPAAAVIALNRLGFGPRPGDIDAFDSLGVTDVERLNAYVEEQLDPDSIDDSAAEARLAQSAFTTLDKTLEALWQDHVLEPDDDDWDLIMQPFWETQFATFLRGIHSKKQLLEVLTDFWHNHFNVDAFDDVIGPLWPHSDRDAIRGHAMGNFRQLLEAVARSPAMLWYLDNAFNSLEDANENYARELMELHTLGAAAYLGSLPQSQVPVDDAGWRVGYVEEDVVAAARCLTGWTVDDEGPASTGTFLYRGEWHDQGPKTVLGVDLPAAQAPMQDGWDLLDLLSRHPATARHIATKLCRRLIGDNVPESVVDAAAAVFTAQVDAPDQLAQVVRAIVLSDEFLTTWGDKVKRPFEIAVSAFRGAGGDLPFIVGDSDTDWFFWTYVKTGHGLFFWHTPDGYPDVKEAWNTTAPRVMCWRVTNLLTVLRDPSDNHYFDLVDQTPAAVRSAQDLVAFWTDRILGRPAEASEEAKLVDFMAQEHDPTFPLPLDTDGNTRERLRAMVGLIFIMPSFLWR
ncbi:MAG: DUF1800 domain-containing protein [Acidobacteriota bacterium]